jgi:hypothetical protein
MNTKKMVTAALFLSVGFILHQLMPGLPLGNMKPSPNLAMMFLAILYVNDRKGTVAIGLTAGLLSAMTTVFPMGQIPSVIDKTLTAIVVFQLFHMLRNMKNGVLKLAVVSAIGTVVSGTIFLGSALMLFSLPAPFMVLFMGVVLPAVAMNVMLVVLIDRVLSRARVTSRQTA